MWSLAGKPAAPGDVARSALFYAGVFAFAFALFRVESIAKYYTAEFLNHIALARKLVEPDPFGFKLPHPGFHWLALLLSKLAKLRLEDAGVLVLSGFVVWIAHCNQYVLQRFTRGVASAQQLLWLGTAVILTNAIYFPPISKYFYLGQGSPNFWAVPTLVVVKPFSLFCVLLWLKLFDREQAQGTWLTTGLLALSAVSSVVMKPSFLIVFLPVAGIHALLKWRQWSPRLVAQVVLAFLPSLALLGYQYYKNFASVDAQVIVTWFGVWRKYTSNIPGSILLGLAFPLALCLCRLRQVWRNETLLFTWGMWVVAFLQFAFLAEKNHFDAGNFSWGYNIVLWLLFLLCAAEWWRWINETSSLSGWRKHALFLVSALFSLHVVSGVFYLVWQLMGNSYH